jgi:hypothetical protein
MLLLCVTFVHAFVFEFKFFSTQFSEKNDTSPYHMQFRTIIFRAGAAVVLFRSTSVAFTKIRLNLNAGTAIQSLFSSFSTITSPDAAIPVPTNMASWIQPRLTGVYEAAGDDAFQSSFGQLFSSNCELRIDHAVHPLQTFKDDLASRRTAVKNVTVAWDDVISTNDDKPDQVSSQIGSKAQLDWWMGLSDSLPSSLAHLLLHAIFLSVFVLLQPKELRT